MRQDFIEFTLVVKPSFMTVKPMTNIHQAVIHSGPLQGPMTMSGNVSSVFVPTEWRNQQNLKPAPLFQQNIYSSLSNLHLHFLKKDRQMNVKFLLLQKLTQWQWAESTFRFQGGVNSMSEHWPLLTTSGYSSTVTSRLRLNHWLPWVTKSLRNDTFECFIALSICWCWKWPSVTK